MEVRPTARPGEGFRVPMAPLESQMAGEKWELPPQLSLIPTRSPPRFPPHQRLSGTRSDPISAGSSKSTEQPAFSPKIFAPPHAHSLATLPHASPPTSLLSIS